MFYITTYSSLNQIRVRDAVVDKPSTFIIQRIERTAYGMKEEEDGQVTKIECESKQEKVEWATALDTEVKDLIFFSKRLTREYSSSTVSLNTF